PPGVVLNTHFEMRKNADGQVALFDQNGREFKIVIDQMKGYLEPPALDSAGQVALNGWSTDTTMTLPARGVVVFADGAFVKRYALNVSRPTVGQWLQMKSDVCGFMGLIPSEVLLNKSIRAFAISSTGCAEELSYIHDHATSSD